MCSSLSAVRPALLRFAVVGQYEPGERLVGIALQPLVIRIDAGEAGRYLVAGEVFLNARRAAPVVVVGVVGAAHVGAGAHFHRLFRSGATVFAVIRHGCPSCRCILYPTLRVKRRASQVFFRLAENIPRHTPDPMV